MANPQEGSRLMQLPREIRDEIYSFLFTSTRFCHGRRAVGRIDHRRVVSAYRGKSLAILRTCRRIHNEVGSMWLEQALFHFEEPEAMLDKLATLPHETLAQIRHVRVSGQPIPLPFEDDEVYYRLAHVLKLLPGLRLDVLTVLGPKDAEVSYDTVNTLIQYSDGWRELRFLSHTPAFLAYANSPDVWAFELDYEPEEPRFARRPQPSSWQEILERRDGASSSPSVTVYLANNMVVPCAILARDKREPYSQTMRTDVPVEEAKSIFATTDDAFLTKAENSLKEVMVLAVRGNRVDYAEKEGSPYLEAIGDIRADNDNKTWPQIKQSIAERARLWRTDLDDDTSDSEDNGGSMDDNRLIVDTYTNVDGYTWPPLHFVADQGMMEPGLWYSEPIEPFDWNETGGVTVTI